VLDWDARETSPHKERLTLVRALLKVRRERVAPLLPAMIGEGTASLANSVLRARWASGGRILMLLANLADDAKPRPDALRWGDPIWGDPPPPKLPPWSVYAAIGGA